MMKMKNYFEIWKSSSPTWNFKVVKIDKQVHLDSHLWAINIALDETSQPELKKNVLSPS